MNVFVFLWHRTQWELLQVLCSPLNCQLEGSPIPVTEQTHPLLTYEVTEVNRNIFRFVIFVLWLKTQPRSYQWYQIIKKKHRVPTIPQIFWLWCRTTTPCLKRRRRVCSPSTMILEQKVAWEGYNALHSPNAFL